MIFNQYASSLSELDMQVVKCVPPGGNWKNIPESIPSQRLAQIRESYKAGKGSRSTYYGRLRLEMPAYTINIYFNRPGNGCNIHYDQDRTISQRESARFQNFPDSFEFVGSLGAINNQIGNAVPPLLAYQIAKNVPLKGNLLISSAEQVDLLSALYGRDGLLLSVMTSTAMLLKHIKEILEARQLSVTLTAMYNTIIEKAIAAKKANPDLPLFVLGGSPCQGFSTANHRNQF